MEKNKNSKLILKITTLGLLGFSLLILMIIYAFNLSSAYGGKSIWATASFVFKDTIASIIGGVLVLLFVVSLILLILSIIQTIVKKYITRHILMINVCFNLAFLIIYLFLVILIPLYDFAIWVILLFEIIFNIGALVTSKFASLTKNEEEEIEVEKPLSIKLSKIFILVLNSVSIFFIFISLSIPLFSTDYLKYSFFEVFNNKAIFGADMQILAMALFAFFLINLIVFIFFVCDWLANNNKYYNKSNLLIKLNLGYAISFFIVGFAYRFVYTLNKIEAKSVSYLPFIIIAIISVSLAYFQGHIKTYNIKSKKAKTEKHRLKILPLIFLTLFTVLTICSIFFNFIEIKLSVLDLYGGQYKITGQDLLKDYGQLNLVFQICAFIYFMFIFSSGMLLLIAIVSFVGKSNSYYKVVKSAVYSNFIFMFILAMFGVFFMFNQALLDIYVKTALEYLGVIVPSLYSYTIKSQVSYVFLGSLGLLLIMILTRQLNHNFIEEKAPAAKEESINIDYQNPLDSKENTSSVFDPCPAFSEIDSMKPDFDNDLNIRRRKLFEDPTLPKIAGFIVNYASRSRLHLYYAYEDIATFIAGLGSAKLSILQGLSGTGKTSLPKIFAEAIIGNCELIEVESSWRDKNELIGYYNEFSKRFTPRKFTQALYKAKLNPEIPTFIVLDEMNLSRIEYYFSDFLSLMEAEEDKRALKLLNIKIAPQGIEDKTEYLALEDGHTIKIPNNIWFVGTANHDESTFEISDKVYDRAQTMNFYKRANKMKSYEEVLPPKFLPYKTLSNLFKDAKNKMKYDAENDPIIKEVEALLTPYNISIGNRSLNQIEDFVKIYCACFIASNEIQSKEIFHKALETVLYSKVVRKLITRQVDDKETLATAFDKLQLSKCSTFIRQLNEE